uniref:Uncharacterized protein n=1 Tax=Rhizophora mucronata TaxID=61149 RepID=A0A2P2N3G5_RHIMU
MKQSFKNNHQTLLLVFNQAVNFHNMVCKFVTKLHPPQTVQNEYMTILVDMDELQLSLHFIFCIPQESNVGI